ncbi:UNVERIFIED_CONTAM: hypothetical protein HDU68_011677 [Siphonaria sp. JEL0065]|nr:hypothetical protein HDU68_011677 [Siphonaria sp. JEL0065]
MPMKERTKSATTWLRAKHWVLGLLSVTVVFAIITALVVNFRSDRKTGNGEPNPSPTSTGGTLTPAKLLSLGNNWRIQMPSLDESTNTISVVSNPDFQQLSNQFFHLNQNETAAVFYTNNTGVTTPGSHSPRTELRQMTDDGTKLAAWSADDSVGHSLNVTLHVDHIPQGKFVIVSQVIASEGPMATIRVNATAITTTWQVVACFATQGGCKTLDSNYSLGTPMALGLHVANSLLLGSYWNKVTNTTVSFTHSLPSYDTCSFKLGSYCGITSDDSDLEYCQVSVFSVLVK